MSASDILRDLSFRHAVAKLHRRGPRWIAELLAELGADHSIQTSIEAKLGRYNAVPDEAAAPVDDFPPLPLHEVRR